MIKKATKLISKARPHASNILWSNVNQVVIVLANLGISIVFARFADKALYGQFLFILATFSLLSIVSIPGTRTVIFRTVAQGYDGVYAKATSFSFLWSMLGIPLVVITGVILYHVKSKILGTSLVACALLFPFVTSLQNWMLFLKGRADFKRLSIYSLIKFLTILIAVALSIILSKNLIVILLAYYFTITGFNIFYHLKSLRILRNDRIDQGWKKQSFALTIMDLSVIAFGQVDIVLIGALLPLEQVAIYGLVMKFVDVFLKTIKCTVEGILPSLFRSKVTVKYFYKFFFISFLIPVILYPVIRFPILFLFSRKYSDVIIFSKVYIAVIPFYFLDSIANCFLIKYQLNMEINISRIVSIIAVIILYAILIPWYGIWGGVISSILYYMIQLMMNLIMLRVGKPEYGANPECIPMNSEDLS